MLLARGCASRRLPHQNYDLVLGVRHTRKSPVNLVCVQKKTPLNSPSGTRVLFIKGTMVLQVQTVPTSAPAGSALTMKHGKARS